VFSIATSAENGSIILSPAAGVYIVDFKAGTELIRYRLVVDR
jgi:hypothetical protein